MAVRKIIEIDDELCTGCGICIPNCPEGALQIIDGKARLISDIFCDGLGACLGECPEDAISIIEREAEDYSERLVMENMMKHGDNTVYAHLKHLQDHGETGFLNEALAYLEEIGHPNLLEHPPEGADDIPDMHACGMDEPEMVMGDVEEAPAPEGPRPESQLRQWPVQLHLVNPNAPFLQGKELLVAADCVPFALASFHQDYLKGRSVVIGCPKLDDARAYLEKFTQIFEVNDIEKVTLLHMEVPCCFGLKALVDRAIQKSGKSVEMEEVIISVQGKEI
ncbi:MAG: 4Fe-4S binding protein [Thermoplasmata archaeon]|nr:MAG: 4Fe-4S binding protein [Thermoplasmata archaeon]